MKSVQQYIDETPFWKDGTDVSDPQMTRMQWRIWWLATAGKFFEGLVIFMTGVALPLMELEFKLNHVERGMIAAATLAGILVGATALGGLADRVGRKQMFIIEMALFTLFLALVSVASSFTALVTFLFGMGLALGCDYPTAHLVISESIPSRMRGRLVLSAFGFQAVGALAGTALGLLILQANQSESDWRYMFASAILPALLVLIGRFFIPQSGHWLVAQGRIEEAERELQRLLHRNPRYPKSVKLTPQEPRAAPRAARSGYSQLVHPRHRRATVLAAVPWFLQDLSTYGIGIFTPTILATTIGLGSEQPANLAAVIHNDLLAAKGAALIDVLLIVGILGAVLLADRVGRIRLQILGFIGCAVGLLLAAASAQFAPPLKIALIFAGFMLFNFMTNLGPNAMTYLIAGEVFPTSIRGLGAGFAASFAKIGAVLTSFFFPFLLHWLGTTTLLCVLAGASLLGAWMTRQFAIETTGVNLESIGLD